MVEVAFAALERAVEIGGVLGEPGLFAIDFVTLDVAQDEAGANAFEQIAGQSSRRSCVGTKLRNQRTLTLGLRIEGFDRVFDLGRAGTGDLYGDRKSVV